MSIASERVITAISDRELDRRWRAAREEMDARKIDALIMQNSNDWLGGYVKWFTDLPATNGYPKTVIFHAADPMTFYGLPTSAVVDNGNHYAIRLQRAVIQQWKVDVPWAKAGEVTVANGGDVAKEAGMFGDDKIGLDVWSPP